MKIIKAVTVSALFPELKGGKASQQGRGRGSTLRVAAANAMRDMLKQKGLRQQRFSHFSATFTVGTIKELNPEEQAAEDAKLLEESR